MLQEGHLCVTRMMTIAVVVVAVVVLVAEERQQVVHIISLSLEQNKHKQFLFFRVFVQQGRTLTDKWEWQVCSKFGSP